MGVSRVIAGGEDRIGSNIFRLFEREEVLADFRTLTAQTTERTLTWRCAACVFPSNPSRTLGAQAYTMATAQQRSPLSEPGPSSRLAPDDASAATTTTSTPRPIASRVRSVLLQGPHDAKQVKAALDTLASMYPVSPSILNDQDTGRHTAASAGGEELCLVDTARARRDLDGDVRARMLSAMDSIIDVLRSVDDGLVRLSDEMAAMHSSCDAMQDKIQCAHDASRHLVEHAEGLERQRAAALVQIDVAQLFLDRFTLTPVERAAIDSREVRVSAELFQVMDKLVRIRTECQVLLQGSESIPASTSASSAAAAAGGGTRAGMEIMSSTAHDLEQAYEKLYKWCSFEFRQPVKEGLEVSPSLREATRRLRESRQDLLRSALKTLVQTRSSILASAFMAALTVGAGPPTYLPGPIELHAHDPMRYVGDMLAWIHQTVASEREFLTALFDEKEGEGGRRIGQRRRGLEGSVDLGAADAESLRLGAGEALVREVLNSNLDGCCGPLKLRIGQTLRSQEGSVTSYRLAHLVQFYRSTMDKTIGSRASLSRTLAELAELAVAAFADTLTRQSRGIERYDGSIESDLSPPPPLLATLGTLKELMGEFSRSLAEDDAAAHAQASMAQADGPTPSLGSFEFVLATLVDALVTLVVRMAEAHISKRPRSRTEAAARWEALVWQCNCLDVLVSTLGLHPFAATKTGELRARLDAALAEVAQVHSANVLARAGLATVLAAMEAAQAPASKVAGARQAEVVQALERLEQCLAHDDLLTPRELARMASPASRQDVHHTALKNLTRSYQVLVEALADPNNQYDVHVKRSPQDVAILLGL